MRVVEVDAQPRSTCPGLGAPESLTEREIAERDDCARIGDGLYRVHQEDVCQALRVNSAWTAWTMLHRVRSVLVRPGRDRLTVAVHLPRRPASFRIHASPDR